MQRRKVRSPVAPSSELLLSGNCDVYAMVRHLRGAPAIVEIVLRCSVGRASAEGGGSPFKRAGESTNRWPTNGGSQGTSAKMRACTKAG
jgi:hypothetical protein